MVVGQIVDAVMTGALLEASSEPIAVPWGATVLLGDRYFVVNRA